MSDLTDVSNALIAKLNGDSALLAQLTDGVYFDVPPVGKTKFGIVSLVDEEDAQMFGGRAFEDATFMVEARVFSPRATEETAARTAARLAAARIDALLENGTLAVPGYSLMVMRRVRWHRGTETDDIDQEIRWFRSGGDYQLAVSSA